MSVFGDWEDRFPLEYAAASLKNGKRHRARKSANQKAEDRTDGFVFRDIAIDRARSRRAAVQMRLGTGFRWFGGRVGGNPLYGHEPFIFPGLVSDGSAILKLFATKTPRARNLVTGHSKDRVEGTDSKLLALDCAYVSTNAQMRGVLRVEIDAVLPSWAAIPGICDEARLPPPNIAVGHVDALGRLYNPHLLWIVEHSVAFTPNGRNAPKRLYMSVLRGFTAALTPHGADPGGLFNALKTKNPLSPLWKRAVFAATPYDLTTLRQHVDNVTTGNLQVQPTSVRRFVPDHPDPLVAAQSNKVFREVASFARGKISHFRESGVPFEEFLGVMEDEAYRICGRFRGDDRQSRQAARRTAHSVAKWTWEKYQPRQSVSRVRLPEGELRARQAAAGQATAARRRSTTEAAVLAAASSWVKHRSTLPTQSDLVGATGKSERTIRRYARAAFNLASGAPPQRR